MDDPVLIVKDEFSLLISFDEYLSYFFHSLCLPNQVHMCIHNHFLSWYSFLVCKVCIYNLNRIKDITSVIGIMTENLYELSSNIG